MFGEDKYMKNISKKRRIISKRTTLIISIIAITAIISFSNIPKTFAHVNTESGYAVAIKRQIMYQTFWWGIPYHVEEILWINMNHDIADIILGTNNIEQAEEFYAHIALSIGVSMTGPEMELIITAIELERALARETGYNRVRGDCLFGIGGQILPNPLTITFWFDYGNDGVGYADGVGGINLPLGGGLGLAVLIANKIPVPNVWIRVL